MIPLSFLTPFWLLSLCAIPLLILAYLKRQQSKRYVVSSVLVLRTLSRKVSPKKRFLPPLRFFLELLALLCLTIAAAQPFLDLQGEKIAVLLDNSLSMKAQANSGSAQTRFEVARDSLRSWVKRQSAASTYSLFVASPHFQQQSPDAIDSATLLRTLDSLEPTAAPDALEGAAGELISSDKFDKVLIVSDKKVDLESSVQGVESLLVGTSRPNLAIQNLRIEKPGVTGGRERLLVGLSYSGEGEGSVPVQLAFISEDGAVQKLEQAQVKVRPAGISETALELPESVPGKGFYRVTLETGKGDSLKDDNSAFITAQSQADAGVLLIHGNDEQGDLGLSLVPELAVRSVRPEEFQKLSKDELKKYLLLIFHRTAPVTFFEQPMLVILPPLKNPLFPGRAEVSSPKVSSWVSEHPITSYLRVPLLTPPASVIFEDNLWSKPVIRSENGPILLAGEGRGVRFAVLGFEIFPFEGAKTPVPSVLTLNLLSWLRGGLEIGGERRTGGTLVLHGKDESLLRIVGQTQTEGQKPGGVIDLLQAGGYVIAEGSGNANKLLAVNVFHAEESNTFQTQSVNLSSGIHKESGELPRGLPLWSWLTWAAVGFIFLETLLAILGPKEERA